MKYLILAAIALIGLACSSHSQTIKSLGYDTTNGRVIYGGTNTLTFTNPLQFESGVRAATRTNLGGTTVGNAVFTATNAAAAATAIGLGATNNVTFSNITANGIVTANDSTATPATNAAAAQGIQWPGLGGSQHAAIYGGYSGAAQIALAVGTSNALTDVATFRATGMTVASNAAVGGTLAVSNTATFATNVTVNGNLSVGSLTTTTPSTWALDATQTAAATNGILALPSNANVIRLTNSTAISGVSGGVLGAFYYLVNQTTNAVTISNVGGITVQGGTSLTLGANQAATLVATGATNASVAARGGLGTNDNVTFSNIVANGSVGIGIASPNTALHISKNATGYAAGDAQLTVGGSSTNADKKFIIGYNTTDNFSFLESAHFGVAVTPIILNPSGGNVGIGMAPSADKLAVNGTMSVGGNATLNGVNNTAPSQTASSGASLMTRDLVETEMGTVREEINYTYWFGLQGQGNWSVRGSGGLLESHNTPFGGFGAAKALFSTNGIGSTARGAMLTDVTDNGYGMFYLGAPNNVALQARILRNAYSGGWPTARAAASFQLAPGQVSYETIGSFWGFTTNTIGLFYVPQPTNSWAASTAVNLNDRIAVSNVVWSVATAGTTGTNEPAWTDLIDSTVTNGTAVFRNVGPHTGNQWVLARGHTNASQVVMTNTGKSNYAMPAVNDLFLRYDAATTTMFARVKDATGTSAEVSLPYPSDKILSPAFFARPDFAPAGTDVRDTAAALFFLSIQSTMKIYQ